MKIILLDFLARAEDILPSFSAQKWPMLAKLLRGKSEVIPQTSMWQLIESEPCTVWPGIAPITLAYDMPHAQAGFWLRADPVLLQPSIDNLILLPAQHLAITQAESDALIQSLNTHFAEDGMIFYAPTPERWYVHCAEPQVEFVSLEEVEGRQIITFLPRGEDALIWHRYMNEIQMLFYTHPVNEARSLARRPLISSVWFWGGGGYPVSPQEKRKNRLFTDKEELVRQAKVLGYETALLKDKPDGVQHEDTWLFTGIEESLVKGGTPAWLSMLKKIEQDYLPIAYDALKAGKIGKIELILTNDKLTYKVVTYPRDRWCFWRRMSSELAKLTPFRKK